MKESETQTDPRYSHVRDAFSKLDTQDKAAFVLEATFDTLGQALHDVGKSVGDAVDRMGREDFFDDFFRRPMHAPEAPGAAEPPTSASKSTTKASRPKGKTKPDSNA